MVPDVARAEAQVASAVARAAVRAVARVAGHSVDVKHNNRAVLGQPYLKHRHFPFQSARFDV